MSRPHYTHKFVRFLPEKLEEEILYVSVEFGTAAHRCFCGCGSEVYTRFSPSDWSMKFDGDTVSIDPSIGNWSFPCQSHYFLTGGKVIWARRWTQEQVKIGRALDRDAKKRYYAKIPEDRAEYKSKDEVKLSVLQRMVIWLRRI